MPDTYLLLPAYNEETALPGLVRAGRDLGLHVVVVDDGSSDATARVARAAGATVIQHRRNRGLAAAIRTLLGYALDTASPGDHLALMDADGTMHPRAIPEMSRRLEEREADIVIASRFTPDSQVRGVPPLRRLYSLGTRALFQLMAPVPGVRDYTSGFRVYRAGLLQGLRRYDPLLFRAPGFSAQTDLLLNLRRMRPRVVEVPLELAYDRRGTSKMRVARTIREYLHLAWRAWVAPDAPVDEGAILRTLMEAKEPLPAEGVLAQARALAASAPRLSGPPALDPALRRLLRAGYLEILPAAFTGGHELLALRPHPDLETPLDPAPVT